MREGRSLNHGDSRRRLRVKAPREPRSSSGSMEVARPSASRCLVTCSRQPKSVANRVAAGVSRLSMIPAAYAPGSRLSGCEPSISLNVSPGLLARALQLASPIPDRG
jgi:hypothetical protein